MQAVDYAGELAYGVMVSVAYRLAEMDANGETEAAAKEYQQHVSAMSVEAKAEFDRVLATAAANLQSGMTR
jgi:hypothetical protein